MNGQMFFDVNELSHQLKIRMWNKDIKKWEIHDIHPNTLAENVVFSDGQPLQEKIDNGTLGSNAFKITKTYPSIAEMEADYDNEEVKIHDFVIITSNVEDEDNAKLFVKTESGFKFITDMSGATGIQGPKGEKGDSADMSKYYTIDQIKEILFNYATEEYVEIVYDDIVGNVSENLNTLEKLAKAIDNDYNFHNSLTIKLNEKANRSDLEYSNPLAPNLKSLRDAIDYLIQANLDFKLDWSKIENIPPLGSSIEINESQLVLKDINNEVISAVGIANSEDIDYVLQALI